MNLRIAKTLSLTALVTALAACSSVPLDQDSSRTGEGDGTTTSGLVMDPFNPESPLAQQRSVYFEYDSYAVPAQYRNLVEMHASYLLNNSQNTIRIEGNADARGGSEYNLALGQRRSDAVGRMMTLMGVSSSQIETVSFGKERPKALGNTEADYAENRRADIVYQR